MVKQKTSTLEGNMRGRLPNHRVGKHFFNRLEAQTIMDMRPPWKLRAIRGNQSPEKINSCQAHHF